MSLFFSPNSFVTIFSGSVLGEVVSLGHYIFFGGGRGSCKVLPIYEKPTALASGGNGHCVGLEIP